MMNSFPLKFQQAESDKRIICRSKEGVRDNNSNSSHTTEQHGEDGAHSPQQRSTATTERNRRENDKQMNERKNRIG
jgi:hypothetical protein